MFILAAIATLAFSVSAAAQHYDYTRFGITGGVTSSSSKVKNVDSKSISLYHAGIAFEIPLGAGFAIQPEVLYQVKGMSLNNWGDSTTGEIGKSFETKVGFVEVPVQIQWGPDLVAFRPYGFVEPFAAPFAPFSTSFTTSAQSLDAIVSSSPDDMAAAVVTQHGIVPLGTVRDHPEGMGDRLPLANA